MDVEYALNRDYKVKTKKSLIIDVVVLIIISLMCGYYINIVGSHSAATTSRNETLDEKSLNFLSGIETRLIYDYNKDKSNTLPLSIDHIIFKVIDPNTSELYPYKVIYQDKDKAVFELCPTFVSRLIQNYKNRDDYDQYGNYGNDFIYDKNIYNSHDIGRVCYQTAIIKTK